MNIQFNAAPFNGGDVISNYVIQWDYSSLFNSGSNKKPLKQMLVPANSISKRSDVQLISVVSDQGFHPAGTFVVYFDNQATTELDYNISASGLKVALEQLDSVNEVNVERHLFCSNEKGKNKCNDERGYVWRVTMVDVQETGNQYEEYKSSKETVYGHRLRTTGTYLLACDDRGVEQCGSPRPAHIYVGYTGGRIYVV